MKSPIEILNTYVNFRMKIKELKNSDEKSIEQCVIIPKDDMANWKKTYEYSKNIIYNNSELNNWESIILAKNFQMPKFHILKEYKDIKDQLSKGKGISFVNQEFINYFLPSNKYDKVNCYFGRKRIVIELNGGINFSNCLICKTGSKSTLKYFIYETIPNYKNSLIDDILKKKLDLLEKRMSFPQCKINKIYVFKCYKTSQSNTQIEKKTVNKLNSFKLINLR